MPNILTLAEAMSSLPTDNDSDKQIENALPEIDTEITIATGVKWHEENPIYPLAKKLAKIKLRLALDMSTNPQLDQDRETFYTKQLQAEAQVGSRFSEVDNGEE